VWEDKNANGVQDAGEPGVPGVTVKLLDATGTTVLATTTTDGSGLYLFTGLTPGTYTVMFVPPSGYMVSPKGQGADDAKDSDADLSTGMTGTYTLASGQTNLTVDAGLFRKAALGDFVWEDKNVNGAQDAGEPGIPGVTVKLLDATGTTVLATTTTDASGLYLFTGLTPGTYKVMFVQPAGYTASPKDQGADDAKDSDADTTTGMTGTYTLVSGQTNLTVDAGFYKLGVIKGTKYEDVSGNGLSADDVGLGGVVVYLDANNNGVKDPGERSTTTAADGTYQFTGLTPGTYIVREVVPTGYVRTYPALADYYSVVIASGTVSSGNNFANAEKCDLSKVTNVKFTVQHTDGTTVCVTDLRGNTDEGDLVTVTYTYTGTEAHDFTLVSYTAPQPYFDANTASQQRIFDLDTETVTAGTHTLTVHVPNCFFQIDFVCGLAIDQLGPAGSNIFYTPQMRLISADNDGTHACGSNPGMISGVKFHDLDADGVKDASEPGLGGWTIYIDANNNGVKDAGEVATVTGPDGSYKFNNLPAGTYRLREVMQPGWYQSKAPAAITLAGGQSVTDALFGNFKKGSLSGYKFYDKNADGVWDKNGLDNCSGNSDDEVGLANWKIFLDLDGDGVLDGNEPYTVTDCNGYYSFSNLTPGTYQVREVMQPGWIRTTDNPTVALTSGQNVTNVLIGNFKGGLVVGGDTATIGFWHNKNGQALLNSLNGGSSSKALGNWLASNFPKLYGSSAGNANNLSGKTNAQVASYFQTLFGVTGMKLEAQMLATAFAVYVTSSSLAGGSYAAAYGFNVTSGGVGGEGYNIGSNGAAFGVVDGSLLTVMDILKRANDRAVSGMLYANDSTLRSMANAVFSGINQSGDITG
jgi:protocatechuate 3,4-dioxygenase beta subunit